MLLAPRVVGTSLFLSLDVKKGTPILPLMFSVKTSIKGVSTETCGSIGVDYSDLPDDAIKIEVIKDDKFIQSEIVLNKSLCSIPSFKDMVSDDSTTVQDYHFDYECNFSTGNLLNSWILKDVLRDFGYVEKTPIIAARPTYTYKIYENIPVSSKVNINEIK